MQGWGKRVERTKREDWYGGQMRDKFEELTKQSKNNKNQHITATPPITPSLLTAMLSAR
jgi:hypothetical protein